MGTPDFAVPTLRALHDGPHAVVAVVTNPDRPSGRGRRTAASPVKKTALQWGYDVVQPKSGKDPWFQEKLEGLHPDLLIVIAYGQILPPSILEIPSQGAINVHASLLPRHRGPAPIQWAIITGDHKTGVTTMWMAEGMDTGDILLQAEVPITPVETSISLHEKLSKKGAVLLVRTLEQLTAGRLSATPQDESQATIAPLLRKEDGRLDWAQDAETLDRLIRGVNPWPGAFAFLFGKRLKVFAAEKTDRETGEEPGTVLDGFPGDMDVATAAGVLRLKEVQLESGKRLAADDFLRGCPVPPGTVLT
jgi:methionyl-tRNA formyltransferase